MNLLHSEIPVLHEYKDLLINIQRLVARNWCVQVQYVDRDENEVADLLAKQALSEDPGLIVLHEEFAAAFLHSRGIT